MLRRDTGLVVALVSQSAISAAASSAGLSQIASPGVIASVGLLSAMLSSGLAAYVAATRERPELPPGGISPGQAGGYAVVSVSEQPSGR